MKEKAGTHMSNLDSLKTKFDLSEKEPNRATKTTDAGTLDVFEKDGSLEFKATLKDGRTLQGPANEKTLTKIIEVLDA